MDESGHDIFLGQKGSHHSCVENGVHSLITALVVYERTLK